MSQHLRLGIIGSSGRMGQEIVALAKQDQDLEVTAGLSSKKDESVKASVQSLSAFPAGAVDVIIDFSQPDLFASVVEYCVKNKKALVSGVTGISAADKQTLTEAGAKIPVLWAPNMSLGVAVMAEMMKSLAKLNGFEFQIEELHHKHKKDRPSGTALFLQQKLVETVGPDVPPPLAIRGGGIFGVHRMWAMGEEEVLTIEHSAMNRKVFARGALQAARWIAGQTHGLYSMADVLKV